MEGFFEVFQKVAGGVGGDVEVFQVGVDAQVHGVGAGGADEAGDGVFLAFVEAFGEGEEEGEHAYLAHLRGGQDVGLAIGFQIFPGVAVVEGADEGAHDLFAVGPAEDVGVGGHVGTVAGVAVVVDQISYVVEEGGGGEDVAHAAVQAMDFLPLVEEGEGHGGDVVGVEGVLHGQGVQVVLDGALEHVFFPVAVVVVEGVVVVEEESFSEAAAGNGEVGGFGFADDFLYHQGAGDDDVSPFTGEAADFLAFFVGFAGDHADFFEKVFHREMVVVKFRQGVVHGALVDFRQVAHGAADADDFHGDGGEPVDFGKNALDEIFHFCQLFGGHIAGGLEHFRQRHGADGDADRADASLVFHQSDFYAGTAQVEEEEIFLINGVDDTGKSQGRFGFAADDGHGDAGGEAHPFQEGGAVYGIAHGGGGDGEDFLDVLHFDDVGVDGKATECPLLRFFGEDAGGEGHAFGKTDGFLFLVDELVGAVFSDLHDDEADGVGAKVNDGDAFHRFSLRFSCCS